MFLIKDICGNADTGHYVYTKLFCTEIVLIFICIFHKVQRLFQDIRRGIVTTYFPEPVETFRSLLALSLWKAGVNHHGLCMLKHTVLYSFKLKIWKRGLISFCSPLRELAISCAHSCLSLLLCLFFSIGLKGFCLFWGCLFSFI